MKKIMMSNHSKNNIMKLCACNNCGVIYQDTNPQVEAREYPETMLVESLVSMPDETGVYQGCPRCQTDNYLTDDIENHVEKNKKMLMESLYLCQDKEEYIEEGTIGHDQKENLIQLITHKTI